MQISMTTPARLYTHDDPGSDVLASRASASFSSAMSHRRRRELELEAPDAVHADLNQTPGTGRVAELTLDRVAIPLLAVVEPAPAHVRKDDVRPRRLIIAVIVVSATRCDRRAQVQSDVFRDGRVIPVEPRSAPDQLIRNRDAHVLVKREVEVG